MIVILVFFWNLVRGLRAARDWLLREGEPLRGEETAERRAAARGAENQVGAESEESRSLGGGGGRAEN